MIFYGAVFCRAWSGIAYFNEFIKNHLVDLILAFHSTEGVTRDQRSKRQDVVRLPGSMCRQSGQHSTAKIWFNLGIEVFKTLIKQAWKIKKYKDSEFNSVSFMFNFFTRINLLGVKLVYYILINVSWILFKILCCRVVSTYMSRM